MKDIMTVGRALFGICKGIFKVGMAAGAAAALIIAAETKGEEKEVKIIVK